MNRFHLIFSFILSFGLNAKAQEPAYLHYGVDDGLPSATVYCSLQDSKGYLWFGTANGLARFDGTRFRIFGVKDGLPDNEVIALFEDSKQRLWVSCFGRTPSYLKDEKLFNLNKDTLLKNLKINTATHFLEDDRGKIWISNGLKEHFIIDGKRVEKHETFAPIRDMAMFEGKSFFLSFWGIFSMDSQNSNNDYYIPQPFFDPKVAMRWYKDGVLTEDENGKWSARGLFVYMDHSHNRALFTFKEGLHLIEFTADGFKELDRLMGFSSNLICSDKSGRFWAGTTNGGVVYFDPKKTVLTPSNVFLPHKKISNVVEDNEGNFIFSTLDDGIYILPDNAAQTYKTGNGSLFLSNNITSINLLGDGTVIAGDNVGNIYLKEQPGWKVINSPGFSGFGRIREINSIGENDFLVVSDLAVFTKTKGVLMPNKMVGAFKTATLDGAEIWIGTSHYLVRLDQQSDNVEISLNKRTMAAHIDSEGFLWVGCLEGLLSEADGFAADWHAKFPHLSGRVIDIANAGDNRIWVVTQELGLLLLNTKEGKVLSVDAANDHLETPIENIQSIFVDKKNRAWLATNRGVFAVDTHWATEHYDQANGLANNDVNAVLVQEDTLWAATVTGLSKLLIKENREAQGFTTLITGLQYTIDAKRKHEWVAPQNREYILPPNSGMLEVELSALHFRSRGNIRFAMEVREQILPLLSLTFPNLFNSLFGGADHSINDGPVRNFGVNIRPGKYMITATAILPGNVISDSPDSITITVLPNWWQTVWLWLAVAIMLITALWRLLRVRENYLKIQNVNSELQLQAIRAQMNPHFVGNSINAIQQFFYPPDPIKASEYISIFSDLLRRTLYFSERDFISFDEELVYIQDYLKMIKLRFGARFNYSINGAEGIDTRVQFPAMLLQPILENATIHGLAPEGDSTLMVSFEQRQNKVFCAIQDNGVGIEASKARKLKKGGAPRISKGIAMLEKKISTLNQLYPTELMLEIRDLAVENAQQHGTRVVLSFKFLVDEQKTIVKNTNHK